MARHARPERDEAVRRLQAGEAVEAVAAALSVPVGTVRSWSVRHVEGATVRAASAQAAVASADVVEPTGEAPQGRPVSVAAAKHGRLIESLPVDYLADRIGFLEDCLRDMVGGDGAVPWSSVTSMVKLQVDLHGARAEIIRTEGSRLDLSRDPVQLARAVRRMAGLVDVLAMDLEDTSTLLEIEPAGGES